MIETRYIHVNAAKGICTGLVYPAYRTLAKYTLADAYKYRTAVRGTVLVWGNVKIVSK